MLLFRYKVTRHLASKKRIESMVRFLSFLLAGCLALAVTAASSMDGPTPGDRGAAITDAAPAFYVDEVSDAARAFLSSLDMAQREKVMALFTSPERVTGPATDRTPAFCAVLAWCVGWGLPQCSLTYEQRRALARLLAAALSDSGYQTIRAVLNSHREIGELEEVADDEFIGRVARQCEALEANSTFEIPKTCLPDGKAAPDYVALGGAAPDASGGDYEMVWRWPNGPPKLKGRYQQFCDHNIAFFGEPDSERWAFRFEGHHLTVNLTFERDRSGGYRVYATPLFLGSFPMIAPPSPEPGNTDWQLTWVASQEFMRAPLDHARQFVGALPEAVRRAAFVSSDHFNQAPPLAMSNFPNWLLASTQPDPDKPLPFAPAAFSTADLDRDAVWHLRLFFRRYFDTLHPVIGDQYRSVLDRLLTEEATGSVLWAGDSPEVPGGVMFIHIAVGPLLLELNADNQWSTQHRDVPKTNHLHSMFRDLSFRWDYDASVRSDADHHR